ncbi:SsgA family sporulation/cell division regulator [Streptomyces sp. NBC_00134]|uniref:SsgA family sporulation/cell division regulator n=1 Tax=Streptomyces sp. NBC_00134 TaxID=2975663 RepID=UPI0038671920
MGRDLLADGLRGSADCGDVRVRSTVGRGDQAMYIVLGSPAGTAWSRPLEWCIDGHSVISSLRLCGELGGQVGLVVF